MADLHEWARKWGIPAAAIQDLEQQITRRGVTCDLVAPGTEAAVQSLVRMEAAARGTMLWRNNVGECVDQRGNRIRYGLANDSKKTNAALKSSDLIGIKPVLIGPEHVGRKLGQFVAREVKRSDWRYTGNPREKAQRAFIELVIAYGGDAAFTTGGF